MVLTIKKLISHPRLADIFVMTKEEHLEREISTVTVLDAPDGPSWLKGGELVLTSGYIFKDDKELTTFIEYLIKVNASGLGIKLNRYHQQLSDEVIALANHHSFSLVLIPYHCVWSDVISIYYSLKEEEEGGVHQIASKDIYALYVSAKWGTSQFAKDLAALINCEVLVFNYKQEILFEHHQKNNKPLSELLNQAFLKRFKNRYIERVDNDSYLFKRGFERNQSLFILIRSDNRMLLESVLEVIVMLDRFQKNDDVNTTIDEEYGFFLNKLATQTLTTEELTHFQEIHQTQDVYYSAIAIVENKDSYTIFNQFKKYVYQELSKKDVVFHHHLQFSNDHESLIVLIEIREEHLVGSIKLHEALQRVAQRFYEKLGDRVVISEFYLGLNDVRRCYEQAQQTLNIGRLTYPNQGFIAYDQIALFAFASPQQLASLNFFEIESLLQEEGKNSYDIVQTLETYLEEKNFKKAAERLFLHENTLRYRIQKMKDILRIDFEDNFYASHLLTKIKLWKLL
ncbi:PucR family transcriptional regulator ligand-binding domain-containing protein [Vagococcus sp. BWB3-3]|uniref:PucR family transcriptional regulator ligand-binding domain-containing protein n=1 Tax=Vagococcus allomyrinae TaxID=2794353 RepID=A0A940SW05_9ENTE|nr:PucR family transcriptional regulator ligand-binding domain-containing protein [Vagococcus allomyrinae]